MARVSGREIPEVTFGAVVDGVGWVDSAWWESGLPNCFWNGAPAGLATRRQLRQRGLAAGGHPAVAVVRRRPGGYLHAYLYRLDLAVTKRVATEAVLVALAAAMTARRTCRSCGLDTGCCIPRSLGQCWPCHLSGPARTAGDPVGDPGVAP